MPVKWGGFDLKQFGDAAVRNQMKRLDFFLKQLNANVAAVSSTTSSTTVVSLIPHGSTHLPDNSDALTVVAPVAVGAANSAGSANSFNRSDHVHAHGTFASGDNHTEYLKSDGTRNLTGTLFNTAGAFTCSATGMGFRDRDNQTSLGGTSRYWTFRADASAAGVTGGVTITADTLGALTITRTGTVVGGLQIKVVDSGT